MTDVSNGENVGGAPDQGPGQDPGQHPGQHPGHGPGQGAGQGRAVGVVAAGRADRMRAGLTQRFAPSRLEIVDESARHAGHAGVREGGAAASAGETHYAVLLVSAAFDGVGRVQRSRLVHETLASEFACGLHALSLTLRAPQEPVAMS